MTNEYYIRRRYPNGDVMSVARINEGKLIMYWKHQTPLTDDSKGKEILIESDNLEKISKYKYYKLLKNMRK